MSIRDPKSDPRPQISQEQMIEWGDLTLKGEKILEPATWVSLWKVSILCRFAFGSGKVSSTSIEGIVLERVGYKFFGDLYPSPISKISGKGRPPALV